MKDDIFGNHCYDILYLEDFTEEISKLFVHICKQDCDVYTVLNQFLKSIIFSSLTDKGQNPLVLNMSSDKMLWVFENNGFDWKSTTKKEDVDYTIADWVAMISKNIIFHNSVSFPNPKYNHVTQHHS